MRFLKYTLVEGHQSNADADITILFRNNTILTHQSVGTFILEITPKVSICFSSLQTFLLKGVGICLAVKRACMRDCIRFEMNLVLTLDGSQSVKQLRNLLLDGNTVVVDGFDLDQYVEGHDGWQSH